MNAADLFKAGKLQAAIDEQLREVKAAPADQAKRLFLFELASFAGDLERARKQIDLVKADDPEVDMALQSYRSLLSAETARRQLSASGQQPKFLTKPPEHVAVRLQALGFLREGRTADAAALLTAVNAAAPVLKGTLNDKPFAGLRDADDLFGTVLEVFAHGEYYWVALEQVAMVASKPPKFPRDLLWLPARLELTGSAGDVFLPAVYPGTHAQADEQLKLGRSTDWLAADGAPVRGLGARTFLVGDDGIGLIDWRALAIEEQPTA